MNDDATPPPPIPPADLRVWWLTESDYFGFEPHQEVNPLCIPDYAWEQFRDRYGRAAYGRLWVPDHIQLAALPVAADDPRWPPFSNAGGIVIESRHAAACARWGGTITTLTLDPVEVEDAAETGMGIISSGANGLPPDGACSLLVWTPHPDESRVILGKSRLAPETTLYVIELMDGRDDRGKMRGAFMSDELELEGLYDKALVNWLKWEAESQMREFLKIHSANVKVDSGPEALESHALLCPVFGRATLLDQSSYPIES